MIHNEHVVVYLWRNLMIAMRRRRTIKAVK